MNEQELETKKWYRIYKTIGLLIICAAFFASSLMNGFSGGSILDGIISASIWSVIIVIFRKVLIYIIYGSKKPTS